MSRPPSAADRTDAGVVLPALEPGTRFADRYEIIRRLGLGGMGSVHLARHREMGRLCAIKLLHPRLGRDREARERFTREAQNASRMLHPNICTIYDFGSTPDGLTYLVMEYVEGRPLGAILAESGVLPVRRAVRLAGDIAAGLDAAHELGIVHRDLKPDNVMVTSVRGVETVKLVDFGIAKAVGSDVAPDATATGVVVGTPDYMAPEQFAGDPVDRRTDIYALGLVVYRMLAGTLPYRAATARESLARRLAEPPEPLVVPGLQPTPAAFDEALRRALARDPSERFPSAGALAGALREAIRDLPPEPEEEAHTVRLDAETTRLRRVAAAARQMPTRRKVAAISLAVAGVAAIGLLASTRSEPGDTASRPGTDSAETSQLVVDTSGPIPLESAPASPGRSTPAVPPPPPARVLPPLPTLEELDDPATRDASRRRAEQIYNESAADPVRRAEAAAMLGHSFLADSVFVMAERWFSRAVAAIRAAPEDSLVLAKRTRYEALLSRIQDKLKEPPIS